MEQHSYTVLAHWDPEAEVWWATSADVPGLVAEEPTLEALVETVRHLVPELLRLNDAIPEGDVAPIDFIADRHEQVRLDA